MKVNPVGIENHNTHIKHILTSRIVHKRWRLRLRDLWALSSRIRDLLEQG